ncbi:type IV toxin-antitoxin system AbiEi family antitoxin domain-containing protein [Demequina muriae]|uniref:DUF559 domain-containing protein n=1 Tax=Demequina muriae TaxID=3051664 RepID=A0ABT8GHS4_9MICO|nr:type IV toxin-antitoxin system AbiEi family antitoxin domain-containing protein [Demequina sp. EGI L300058]MDN4480816.1 hypothetical protein [Demequina sp. EGI L300058]
MITEERLRVRGGAARTGSLRAAGVPERAIRAAVAHGSVRRVSRGVLALPDADPRVIAAVALSCRLTCVSALELLEVSLVAPSKKAHIAVPSAHTTARRAWRGVRRHYRSDARPPDAGGAPVETVAQALDDAGRCLDEGSHLVAVDSALHQGLVTAADVAAFRASTAARRAFLLAHADGRAESVGETLARLSCVRQGLQVHPQRFLPGVGRVDLVVGERVVVEIDGRSFHSDPVAFRRDRMRGRAVVKEGMPVLRYAHAELLGADAVDVGDEVVQWFAGAGSALMIS